MSFGRGPFGSGPFGGSVGTAAGTSKAVGRSGTVAVTLKVGGGAIHAGPVPAAPRSQQPAPVAAERLLRWVLPLKVQEPILGDLAEMYAATYTKRGEGEARWLYWWHAIRSIAPILRRVLQWSAVVAIAEAVRRSFGS